MSYVNQLDEHDQKSILKQIRLKLQDEGLSESEINEALDNALNSKLVDVEYMLKGK